MTKVCVVCGDGWIKGTCDECGKFCCRDHFHEIGVKNLCSYCFEEYRR